MIEKKVKVPVGFRMRQCESISVPQTTNFTWRLTVKSSPEKPRYIIVSFQTDKDGNQEKNPSVFNHVNVKNMYITLKWMSWSATQILLLVTIKTYSYICLDVSRQSEKLKNSVTDIQVKAYFNENVPANTEAFAVVISDRVVSFASDGNRMTVIY